MQQAGNPIYVCCISFVVIRPILLYINDMYLMIIPALYVLCCHSLHQTEGFWCAYERLPLEQQDWDAARKLKTELSQYRQILPLLMQLHSKEVKNRHWLQVMSVVNCTFQLEGSIFKMSHLLDAGLLQ